MAVDVIPCVLTVVEMNNILVTSFVQCIYNQRVQERGVLSDNDMLICLISTYCIDAGGVERCGRIHVRNDLLKVENKHDTILELCYTGGDVVLTVSGHCRRLLDVLPGDTLNTLNRRNVETDVF